jgi:hypothetical protein
MDRPMMGPTQQRQVGQIGRAAMEPVPQMMRLTPGQRPLTAGKQPLSRTARAVRWAAPAVAYWMVLAVLTATLAAAAWRIRRQQLTQR